MKYRCTRPVQHDRRRYEPGALIEVYGKHADALLECGAIEPMNKPFAAKRVSVSLQPKEKTDV